MPPRILVIDDERHIREGIGEFFKSEGYAVELAEDGRSGLAAIRERDVDLVITDLRMPGLGGEALIEEALKLEPGLPIIVLTAHGSVENAVECMRRGAFEYRIKPVDLKELALLVQRALSLRALEKENEKLHLQLHDRYGLNNIIGKSPEMEQVYERVRMVAPTKANVLITGESGTGKELVANAIHLLSDRSRQPFVKVHCSALSPGLLESELFGHEKGAFTGANRLHRGRFELANRGTLFLDEIGEIDATIQVKLLRVLQEREFERVGGEETISVDVRLVAATNSDLYQMVQEGSFREDLYYRLKVVHIEVPPLRERRGDIPLLVNSFIKEFCRENGMLEKKIDSRALAALEAYRWGGNVREMKNMIESLVVMSKGPVIYYGDLPDYVRSEKQPDRILLPHGKRLADYEKEIILSTLAWVGGNKTRAAEVLGIGRKTLHRKLEEYQATGS